MSRTLVARICALCNTVVRGAEDCPTCGKSRARPNDKQTIYVDGPSLMATDDKMFPIDPNDPYRRRIVPCKRAYKEHLARSNGKLESAL